MPENRDGEQPEVGGADWLLSQLSGGRRAARADTPAEQDAHRPKEADPEAEAAEADDVPLVIPGWAAPAPAGPVSPPAPGAPATFTPPSFEAGEPPQAPLPAVPPSAAPTAPTPAASEPARAEPLPAEAAQAPETLPAPASEAGRDPEQPDSWSLFADLDDSGEADDAQVDSREAGTAESGRAESGTAEPVLGAPVPPSAVAEDSDAGAASGGFVWGLRPGDDPAKFTDAAAGETSARGDVGGDADSDASGGSAAADSHEARPVSDPIASDTFDATAPDDEAEAPAASEAPSAGDAAASIPPAAPAAPAYGAPFTPPPAFFPPAAPLEEQLTGPGPTIFDPLPAPLIAPTLPMADLPAPDAEPQAEGDDVDAFGSLFGELHDDAGATLSGPDTENAEAETTQPAAAASAHDRDPFPSGAPEPWVDTVAARPAMPGFDDTPAPFIPPAAALPSPPATFTPAPAGPLTPPAPLAPGAQPPASVAAPLAAAGGGGPTGPTGSGPGGGGDRPRTNRVLIWSAAAVALVLVLVGLFVLGTRLPGLFGGPAAKATPTPTASASPTPAPEVTGPAAAGEHPWDQLGGGECIDPFTTPWVETFTVVDCAQPHAAQLAYRGSYGGDATTPFPGEDALTAQINQLCSAPGVVDLAAAAPFTDLQLQGSFPVTEEQWKTTKRYYYCFANRAGGEPLTASVAGPGPAPAPAG
ncbi:hypothetical protein WDJ51_00810 [Rathayibacter sp. YIM 133350]|uniref:hypothetical protein n=1 Tax=Rathayibacter sp. YIM 133350 TaxID=3131992 RepID=UPI00307EBBAB